MSAEVIGREGKQNVSRRFEDRGDKGKEWEIALNDINGTHHTEN